MTDRFRRPWWLLVVLWAAAAALGDDWFGPFERVADYKPKGPTHCFRQFNIDWSWINRRVDQLPNFLSQADPAALADFCRRTHIDGTIVMAVPHHGYSTYETRIGQKFPGMKGDWFGRTIEELHKRHVAAFGYVTLNWNWKYMRENVGRDFIHGQPDADGVFPTSARICFNAPGFMEMVEGYTREVLERYPVDGMRWDILFSAKRCTCDGCKQLYRELYGEELTRWDDVDDRRAMDFYLATTSRVVRRLHALCKQVKPSVQIWQNCIQSYHDNDLDLGRQLDIAYNEFGDPFRLLLIRGVTGKAAAINGLMNHDPTEPPLPLDHGQWRTCLALGGRCYSYYGHKQTDPKTILPGAGMLAWHRQQLAPFYKMVSQIEPWLEEAEPVTRVAIVYSERTRFRFPGYDRKSYIAPMEAITNACLQRSLPIEFINRLDLGDAEKPLSRFKLLVLPLTSGLEAEELEDLRRYVERGGNLLVGGDALRHDARGLPRPDFALAREMGVSYVDAVAAKQDLPVTGRAPGATPSAETAERPPCAIRNLVLVRARSGRMLLSVPWEGSPRPLLHVNAFGQGKIAYLASLDSVELSQQVLDWLAGPPPLAVEGSEGKQVVLTHQARQGRWVLHLISQGEYTVEIRRDDVPARRVVDSYPKSNWSWHADETADGMRIDVSGPADDRLLVLE